MYSRLTKSHINGTYSKYDLQDYFYGYQTTKGKIKILSYEENKKELINIKVLLTNSQEQKEILFSNLQELNKFIATE